MTHKIVARVMDDVNGLRIYENIKSVRIKSREYVLLIMEDYMPALGRIEGDITFLTDEDEIPFKNIQGFYKHQKNEFSLLIFKQNIAAAEEQ